MKTYSEFKAEISEDYTDVKKRLRSDAAKHKKAGTTHQVSFTDNGKKVTGRYGGLMNRGGYSYAKVHADKRLHAVPLPDVQHH